MQTDKIVSRAAGYPKYGKQDFVAALVIALLPFVLLAINNSWIFNSIGYIDPWIYVGFHLHLPDLLATYGSTYYASRVPWTVSGWILHLALDDLIANYGLHFAVFYLATLSLYVTIRTIFANRLAACAATVLLGTHSHFLVAVGWNYVDGPTIACFLAGIAALANAAVGPRWRLAALLWGVASCATVSIYFSQVLFVPIQIGMFLLLNRLRERRPIFMVAALFAAGGVSSMLFFGFANWLLGGPFLYIMGQIDALTKVTNVRFDYINPFSQWAWSSPWLLVPAITFVFSAAYVSLYTKSALKKLHLNEVGFDLEVSIFVCCLADFAASLAYIILQANHFPMLNVYYEASALLPLAYLTIGAALAAMIKPCERTTWLNATVIVVMAVITLAPWELATDHHVFPKWEWFKGSTYVSAWVLAGLLLLLLPIRTPYRLGGAVLTVLFFSIVNLGAPAYELSYPPKTVTRYETLALFDAARAIAPFNRNIQGRFWYNLNSQNGRLFKSIASTYLFEYSLVGYDFPKLTMLHGQQSTISLADRIILLTPDGIDPIPSANAAVADQHLYLEQVGKLPIRRPGVAFTIFVTDVEPDPAYYEKLTPAQAFAGELPSKLVTPTIPWWRMKTLPFSDIVRKCRRPGYVRVRLRVDKGRLGLGVLKKNDTKNWVILQEVVPSPDVQDIFLRIPNFADTGPFVFLNGMNAESSTGVVTTASVFCPHTPSASGVK